MTLDELKPLIRKGKWGIIPDWKGYLKYDYYNKQLYFTNEDYVLKGTELEDKIKDRIDLYYII